jgi:transposase InsO family protein
MAHRNARLNVFGRELLCRRIAEQGWTVAAAAHAAGVSRTTASKWIRRYRLEGSAGLGDRSSRPRRLRAGVGPRALRRIFRRRRLREGPHRISWETGIARSTVYRVLARNGLARLASLGREPRPPARRYEHARPGDLVHLDTKRLGHIGAGGGKRVHGWKHGQGCEHRGIGHEVVHVAVDDHSRLAYAEVRPDETAASTAAFAANALAFYAAHGVTVRRVLTDNAFCYTSRAFLETLHDEEVRARRTRPYRPQTNGKAEAFVKTLVNGWAYARPYDSSAERTANLARFLTRYNHHRPHGGIGGLPPITRVPAGNNVCGKNT